MSPDPKPVPHLSSDPALILRRLRPDDEPVARELHEQFRADDFSFLVHDGTWDEVLAQIARESAGRNLSPGRVRADFFVAEVDGEIVGRSSIRYALTPFLLAAGGHIGYVVAPAFRRRGYAGEILRQSLARVTAAGVERALLVCTDGNIGSAAVIEAAGGVLEDVQVHDGETLRRYWIETSTLTRGRPVES